MERADGPQRPSASQSDSSGIVVEAAGVLAQDLGGIKITESDGRRFLAIHSTNPRIILSTYQAKAFPFIVMPLRAVIAIVACPSYGSIWARTCLLGPVPSAPIGAIAECGNPASKFRVDNLGGTRFRIKIVRPYPDAVQGANKHNGSYIFSHGSIGFLVFSSFVIG